MSKKLDKEILSLTETILADATDEQKKAWIPFLKSMITDEDSPAEAEASPVKKRKSKKDKDSPSPSPDESPDEESPDEEDSPEESPAESPDSPVKKKKGKKKEESPEESPDEEDSPDEESPDEEDSPDEESPDEESPDEDDSPVKKKKGKAKKEESPDEEDSGVDYSSMSERALVKHLTEEKGVSADTLKPIKKDKKKLVKLANGYDELFTKYSAMKLEKLEKLVAKNDIKVSFGRGRSTPEKKIRIIAKTLAANGIA